MKLLQKTYAVFDYENNIVVGTYFKLADAAKFTMQMREQTGRSYELREMRITLGIPLNPEHFLEKSNV